MAYRSPGVNSLKLVSPNRGNIVLVVAIKIPENLKQDQLNIIKDWQKELN